MSTEGHNPGGKAALAALAREAVDLVREGAQAEREAQLDLLEPLTAEETAVAQEELGLCAGPLAVLRRARENRKGRPPGVRNRRTDDTVAYLSQFGPDPLVALMKIIGESEEAMIARSRQLDPAKKQLSYGEARAIRIRCAETAAPYWHGKKPVEVDATIRGVMVVHETGGHADRGALLEGVLGVVLPDDGEAEG